MSNTIEQDTQTTHSITNRRGFLALSLTGGMVFGANVNAEASMRVDAATAFEITPADSLLLYSRLVDDLIFDALKSGWVELQSPLNDLLQLFDDLYEKIKQLKSKLPPEKSAAWVHEMHVAADSGRQQTRHVVLLPFSAGRAEEADALTTAMTATARLADLTNGISHEVRQELPSDLLKLLREIIAIVEKMKPLRDRVDEQRVAYTREFDTLRQVISKLRDALYEAVDALAQADDPQTNDAERRQKRLFGEQRINFVISELEGSNTFRNLPESNPLSHSLTTKGRLIRLLKAVIFFIQNPLPRLVELRPQQNSAGVVTASLLEVPTGQQQVKQSIRNIIRDYFDPHPNWVVFAGVAVAYPILLRFSDKDTRTDMLEDSLHIIPFTHCRDYRGAAEELALLKV